MLLNSLSITQNYFALIFDCVNNTKHDPFEATAKIAFRDPLINVFCLSGLRPLLNQKYFSLNPLFIVHSFTFKISIT